MWISVDQSFFDGFDLQGQIFRVNACLGQAAGDKPDAILGRALIHVRKLAIFVLPPDLTNPFGHFLAERSAH